MGKKSANMDVDAEEGTLLKFAPFQSRVDEGFWHRLSSLKLNKLRLDESPMPITGLILSAFSTL